MAPCPARAVASGAPVPLNQREPRGIPKSRTRADAVPDAVTVAAAVGPRVVTVPTVTVAASPLSPFGIPKSRIAAAAVPALVTVGVAPAARPVTVPIATVAASPLSPRGIVKFSTSAAADGRRRPGRPGRAGRAGGDTEVEDRGARRARVRHRR